MINTTYIRPTTCIDVNQKLLKFCLPELISCPSQPKNGRFVECGQDWNNNIPCKQTNCEYDIPYVKGDILQFQTIFYSGSPNNPTPYDDIVSVELCTVKGTDEVEFTRKMSGWKNKKPYQIIEIDTSSLPNCFSLEFTNLVTGEKCCTQKWGCVDKPELTCTGQVNTDRNGITNSVSSLNFSFGDITGTDFADFTANVEAAGGTIELICTTPECHTSIITITGIVGQVFSYEADGELIEIELTCRQIEACEPTILIQSKRSTTDCFGYCYGQPDSYEGDLIEYNNQIRVHGFIKTDIGFSNTISNVDSSGNLSEEIRESRRLVFRKMPPFMKNIVMSQILTGGEICVDGIEYKLDNVEVVNERQVGHMWQFGVDIYTCCVISDTNCL